MDPPSPVSGMALLRMFLSAVESTVARQGSAASPRACASAASSAASISSPNGVRSVVTSRSPLLCSHATLSTTIVSGTRGKLPSLSVEFLDSALHGFDFALLEVCLTALAADPSGDCIEPQMVAGSINMEGRIRALHAPATPDAVHLVLLALSCNQRASALSESAISSIEAYQ